MLIKLLATPTALEASLTWTTGEFISGNIFTAVWAFDVVAPPIKSGIFNFNLFNSLAKKTISSREGVINPESPIISTFSSTAVFIIFSGGTITPKSMISKLLQAKTTPTIFFPISWTSPLTVAIKIFPAELLESSVLEASIYGSK